MNASCALGAIAALAFAANSFAIDPQTIEVGSFVNTSMSTATYTGPYTGFVSHAAVDGHNVMTIDVAGILDSLGYNLLYSITVTDNGANSYGSLSPGADIDLFRIDGPNVDYFFSYAGPNATHHPEDSDRLGERLLQLDSFSGAQDQWAVTHVSLGQNGSITATFAQPVDLSSWFTGSGGSTNGGGPVFNPSNPPDSEGGDLPILMLSEHGTFESYRVTVVAATVPAPGAVALLGLAGFIGQRRRRRA